MAKANAAVNAGVHNSNGIEFQKHCAIHIILSRYSFFDGKRYFVSIEHHDDVIFGFFSNQNEIDEIEVYQAKKSSNPWTNSSTCTIIGKLTQTGLNLIADQHPKSASYTHSLAFLTNDSITLTCGNRSKHKTTTTVTIDAVNDHVTYPSIASAIQDNVKKNLAKAGIVNMSQLAELQNLSLRYIDFPKRNQEQKDYLIGLVYRLFNNTVKDPKAALDTILELFRDVENFFNKGNIVNLLDVAKRVTSEQIENAIFVITTKSKAYDLWRKKEDEICDTLHIALLDRQKFGLQFQNSIDLFKDYKQAEHKKILKYATDNKQQWLSHSNELACISDMFNSFKQKYSTTLSDLDLKAAICAAYVEIKG
ncbi:DUF4297 domain-containing protein [Flavihumibacter sp. RY-1]|uniref:DUF4297 domain-containing protein n=1 Tax=Flavihumibacter fluminis TaxID=2909236 RepID=A0ABS9BJT8_9BACT|nr:DUF4297 domain-containing protein [Flavihumibacter fluminis]MCF1715372.1 DUF4297 domain-containing protein [Flavihumibacter fluminis]